jgi:hypothetical protein
VRSKRLAAATLAAGLLVVGATACDSGNDDTGARTNLDEVGPQIAKLRLEVSQLRRELRSLSQEVLALTPTTTAPATDPGTTTDTTAPTADTSTRTTVPAG